MDNKEVLLKDNAQFHLKCMVLFYESVWLSYIDLRAPTFKERFEKSLVFFN